MRPQIGRPDIARYAGRFTVPTATRTTPLSVTWLGVATLLLDDGTSAVLTDGFFSRPGLARVVAGRVAPSPDRVDACLSRAGVTSLDAVVCVHSHYDHALDSALVAERTGARLVGGESTGNVGRGHGLTTDRIVTATPGEPMILGSFEITLITSRHSPPDRYPGVIDAPVCPPVRASAYRCGEAWSVLVRHRPTNRRCLIQGSAGYVPGVLDGHRAEVAYLGLGQLGLQSEHYLRQYWQHTVRAVGARTVVCIHWDDFFRPLSKPLRALPFAADDLDHSMRVLGALADDDGVTLHLPMLWQREDPWA